MISLKGRLALTYSLFICLSVLALSLLTNDYATKLFSRFVRENIAVQNQQIVDSVSAQYDENEGAFDVDAVTKLGMRYAHQGFILSITNQEGDLVWDARKCDMQQCVAVINDIETRMRQAHRLAGEFDSRTYPLVFMGQDVGTISIETYGPYFYSESESDFVLSMNRSLMGLGILAIILSITISVLLAAALAKPILRAADTARQMANGNLSIRIKDRNKTKELHVLAESVNELAIALENGERWQKRMTSDIAHELRTPLTTLQGNLEAMIDGIWKPTKENLSSCHEEVVRLNKLVDDLGKLSILEQETLVLHKTEFDLYDLLKSVGTQFSTALEEKGLTLRISEGEYPICADHERLKQVFWNLMSNALKYTDAGSVQIAVEPLEQAYIVRIADTGIGIPAEEQRYLFDRFYRSDRSRSRETGGVGIGLTIAKAIVLAHGGTIDVTSEQGSGSVFSVFLPK